MFYQILSFILIISTLSNVKAQKDPLVVPPRSTMVHLFEWKWTDIAAECERFLGPKGYAAVQISPPNEHALVVAKEYPWYQRYQPVSYKLISRSGNQQQFIDMVNRCNAVGVRIYVDAIINHMAANSGYGSAKSWYNASSLSFPEVPYGPNDFNNKKCQTASGNIENYQDINQVRNCKLVELPDLDLSTEYVKQKLAGYMNYLIDLGVAGFRIDAAKHMWPGDLQNLYSRLKNVRQDIFGANKRPFIYQEVIDLGSEQIKNTDYTPLGRVTEFKYGLSLSSVISKAYGQRLSYLKNFGVPWNFIDGNDAISFIDNHDNQRGHGGGGHVLTFFESRLYKIANAIMLAWPYGFTQIMSSYNFDKSKDWQGPPTNGGGDTKDVIVNPDDTCGNGWICEHRWRQIYNMVRFRNVASIEQVQNWWDNGSNQIAFSRGNKAFLAINTESYPMDLRLRTGLPSGLYCDIISGNKINGKCTGRIIVVNSDTTANIFISNTAEDPIVAFHIESKL